MCCCGTYWLTDCHRLISACRVILGNILYMQGYARKWTTKSNSHSCGQWGFYLWNILRKISNVFLFFFSRCVCEPEKMTWGRENTSSWEYTPKTAIHTNKQPNLHRKNEPPLLCINSSVESFKEEFFTKSKLHDHFVDFNFFQKEVLKLQNQI